MREETPASHGLLVQTGQMVVVFDTCVCTLRQNPICFEAITPSHCVTNADQNWRLTMQLGCMEKSEEDENFWLFGYGYHCTRSFPRVLNLADSSKLQEFDMEATASLW